MDVLTMNMGQREYTTSLRCTRFTTIGVHPFMNTKNLVSSDPKLKATRTCVDAHISLLPSKSRILSSQLVQTRQEALVQDHPKF